ncbi:MAG: DNA-directed RNA polymerase subunit omega [Tenericutes bacterium]|nr:DNA-directed RNA polymerase subunit omega [Bacilli bacterium]MDD4623804.1 DNA-directed RNA polymerase subunit omega [Bacilli bacterium]MDD4831239.1 DNA-directed RNA polymerase subunit omega [Bacilli bacterium]NLV90628.1 DNA-directed RNA polymerase subunit omega [Mycoplasmatota bacterium]
MIYPSIDKILNVIDSKYVLVHIVSKRAREMIETNHTQLKEYRSIKEIGKALEEVSEGLIHVKEY